MRAEDDGQAHHRLELVAMATLVIGAGFETTRNGIAGGVLALHTHPAELDRLRQEPLLDKAAVDEILRIVSPNQSSVARFALEDVEVGGATIPKGAVVAPCIAAANRDPGSVCRSGSAGPRPARQHAPLVCARAAPVPRRSRGPLGD